jgi:hypothetical protein
LTLGLSNVVCDTDVTIPHPTCHSNVVGASKAELHAAHHADHMKHKKHDLALMSSISHDVLSKRMKIMFKSFVVETYGGLHPEARWLLRQIAIRASGHHVAYSREAIVYGVRGSVAVAVQRGNAAVIRAANVKASETTALYVHEHGYAAGDGSAVAATSDAAAAVGVDEQASLAQSSVSLLSTVAVVRLNVNAADVSPAIVLPTRARLHVVTPVASRFVNVSVHSDERHVRDASSSSSSSSSSSLLPTSLFEQRALSSDDDSVHGRTMMSSSRVVDVMSVNDDVSSKAEHHCHSSCSHDGNVF